MAVGAAMEVAPEPAGADVRSLRCSGLCVEVDAYMSLVVVMVVELDPGGVGPQVAELAVRRLTQDSPRPAAARLERRVPDL